MNLNKDAELYTLSSSPHIKHKITTSNIMRDVIIALVPALIWSFIVFGIRAVLISVISVASCVVFEYAFQKFLKRTVTVNDLSAVVTGLLLAFNMPTYVSWWAVVAGAFVSIVIAKQIFGGIGRNVVNPALAGRIFLFVSWPSQMTSFAEPFTDSVSSATPLAALKAGEIPETGILDMFLGFIPGSMGEVSALLLIVGGLYLIFRKVISWHIPVSYILTVAFLAVLFPAAGSPLEYLGYALFSGGLMLGAIFMATDYTTSPVTFKGRLIFGIGCGLLTVLIRYFGAYPEGVSFAIMIMNLLVWYIDRLTMPVKFGAKFQKQ